MKARNLALSAVISTLAMHSGSADNLLKNGGFEEPKISGTVDARKGGSPATGSETSWTQFKSRDLSGKVTVGTTELMARTGTQAIYVQFDNAELTRPALLMSDLLPVKGNEIYRVSLWGRVDSKRPLTLDQGRPYMVVDVEFYAEDQATRLGETLTRTQMIPGMADRLLFLASKWSEYYAEFKAPEGSEFMKVTFQWMSPKREGAADGIIYFDDAAVEGVPGNLTPSLDPPPAKEPLTPAPLPVAPSPAPVAEGKPK